MITFRIVRKIGRMLRGRAGRREIMLGAFCGVLIGFNPVASLTLALAILLALLLNANIGFTLLGVAVGKLLAMAAAPLSFHTGYFLVHNAGLEGLFASLANAPVTALMALDVYAMAGGLPYAVLAGAAFAYLMAATVSKIREQMVRAEQHEKVGKAVGNKLSRFLMWLVFGKQKISTADVLAKQSPLLRKSGLILVGVFLAVGLLLEFLLLDAVLKRGIQGAIARQTGAEVNIGRAHLSLATGKLEIENLQATDPDKPTHDLVRIDRLAADVDVGDLLRKSYTIELLSGGTLRRNVLRDKPGAIHERVEKVREEKPKDDLPGKSIEDYFAKARDWGKYGEQAYEYLRRRRENAEAAAKGEKPKASKTDAVADAKRLGYLRAAADLAVDRPAWTIRRVEIDNILLGGDTPPQSLLALELSSHPELNRLPTTLAMTPAGEADPSAQVVLRFDDPAEPHAIAADFKDIALGGAGGAGDGLPLRIRDGKADIRMDGSFSIDALDVPFTLVVRGLEADVEEGRSVMGMDSKTAAQVLHSMGRIELGGVLGGTLPAPRVQIDYDKLAANMKGALLAAGKEELANRAAAEVDKAKDQVMKKAGDEAGRLLEGEEAGAVKEKAKDALRRLF